MDKLTISTYNKLAQEYDQETSDFWEHFPRDFFDTFMRLAGTNVLNVGSGPGRDGLILKEKGADVVCLDASSTMIDLCKKRGLEAVIGDFMHIPIGDGSFAGAWAYTSLLHIPKKDFSKAIEEIKRILVPQGILGLGLIEGETEEYRESSGVGLPRLFAYYRKDEVVNILKNNGFELLHFDEFQPRSRKYLNFIFKKIV